MITFRCFEGNARPGEPFWTFRDAAVTGTDPEVEFYGVISEWSWLGDELSPKKFKDQLYKTGKNGPITMRINSPGGDPIAASAIASIIANYPGKVTAQIDGQASSAAVMVALAANHVKIQDSAYMMIHDPAVNVLMAALDIATLTSLRNNLQAIKDGLVQGYAARTGLSSDKLARMMSNETWMSAQEAIDMGFADEIIPGGQSRPVKQFENVLRTFQHVPDVLLNMAGVFPPEDTGDQPDAVIEASEPRTEPQAVPDGPEGEPVRLTAAYAERLVLAANCIPSNQGVTMYVRELINQRAALLDEAQALVNQADAEGRDLSEPERVRFAAMMDENGELSQLDHQIERIQAERENLRAAVAKTFSAGVPAQKPEPAQSSKTMKRADFETMPVADRAAYARAGGKIED